MTDVSVLPDRLKTVRKARKIGRTKLAKMTGLTERALTKLETKQGADITTGSLETLAGALQITPFVLTGEFPLGAPHLETASSQKCTNGCCG